MRVHRGSRRQGSCGYIVVAVCKDCAGTSWQPCARIVQVHRGSRVQGSCGYIAAAGSMEYRAYPWKYNVDSTGQRI